MKPALLIVLQLFILSISLGQQEFKEYYYNTSRTHDKMDDVISADFNGDTLIDHISFYRGASTIYLSISDPWTKPSLTPIATNVPKIPHFEVADIDLDNDLDLICSNGFDKETWAYYNDGNANFRQGVWLDLDYDAIHFADLNEDDTTEVLFANFVGLYIYQVTDDEPILIQRVLSGSQNTAPTAIDTYDYNNDGLLDIAVAYRTQIQIYYQNQLGEFSEGLEIKINLTDKLFTTDIDQDGLYDFLLYRKQGQYAYYAVQQMDGSFRMDTFPTTGRYGCGVAEFVDIDSDGDIDVLHMDNDNENGDFSIYYNYQGTFEKTIVSNRITRSNIAGVGDMDNDGLLDIFMFNVQNEIGPFVYENITDVTSNQDINIEDLVNIRPSLFVNDITIETETPITYAIYHSSGAFMTSKELYGSEIIRTEDWPSGVYHIKLKGRNFLSKSYLQIVKP